MSDIKSVSSQRDLRLEFWRESYPEEYAQRFLELEAALLESESNLKNVLGPRASLKAYANHRVRSWVYSATGEVIDPDQIFVKTSHAFKVGGREIVQQDRRTLTEFVVFGLQDNNFHEMSIEGTTLFERSLRLVSWLSSVDIRSDYVLMTVQGTPAEMNEAMQEHLSRKIEFTLFCASVEINFHRRHQEWVTRYLQGDPSLFVRGVVLPGSGAPMKDLFVISERANPNGPNILYAPDAPSGDVWYTFNTLAEMGAKIGAWAAKTSEFIDTHVGSRYRETAQQFFRELAANKRRWTDDAVKLSEFVLPKAGQPLFGIVSENIRWDAFEAAELAPQNYRNAERFRREQFARLNTELKALYTVEARDHALISYNQFAYDLIKYRVEQVLKSRGENVKVDPDLITIELSSSEEASLTSIIIGEKAFYAHEKENLPADTYPRFRLEPAHPPIKTLNILDLASWSRTLRPGEKYIDMLRAVYLDPTELSYAFRRDVYHQRQIAEMQRAVLSEHFQGRITYAQRNGLLSLVNSLTSANKPPLTKYEFPVMQDSVYQFHLGNPRPVEGVYVFRLMTGDKNEDWLYTPQAPDGVWFRPLRQFDASVRIKGLREYYTRRVHYTYQRAVSNYFDELEASTRGVNPPQLIQGSRVRDLDGSYDEMILRVIKDVDAQTTSLAEIITGLTYNAVILAAQVISLVIPPLGLVVSAIQITKNILDGGQAYLEGDNKRAFGHFKDALIDLATLGYGKYKELGKQAITTTQKTLIDFAKDAKKLADLVSAATGQKVPHEILLEIVQDVLNDAGVEASQTIVR